MSRRRSILLGSSCAKGATCTFAHSADELRRVGYGPTPAEALALAIQMPAPLINWWHAALCSFSHIFHSPDNAMQHTKALLAMAHSVPDVVPATSSSSSSITNHGREKIRLGCPPAAEVPATSVTAGGASSGGGGIGPAVSCGDTKLAVQCTALQLKSYVKATFDGADAVSSVKREAALYLLERGEKGSLKMEGCQLPSFSTYRLRRRESDPAGPAAVLKADSEHFTYTSGVVKLRWDVLRSKLAAAARKAVNRESAPPLLLQPQPGKESQPTGAVAALHVGAPPTPDLPPPPPLVLHQQQQQQSRLPPPPPLPPPATAAPPAVSSAAPAPPAAAATSSSSGIRSSLAQVIDVTATGEQQSAGPGTSSSAAGGIAPPDASMSMLLRVVPGRCVWSGHS
jgi:hypothetical protein